MEFEDLKVEVPLDEEIGSGLLNEHVRKYQNKDSINFITGFDVTSKDAEDRRRKRARRFGLKKNEKTENVTEIEALPSSVENLPKQNEGMRCLHMDAVNRLFARYLHFFPSKQQKASIKQDIYDAEVRPDAILLFGVNEMSTKDVFDYFQDYMPGSIEWVDDISCIVVWEDENSAKRAFVNMGTLFTPAQDDSSSESKQLENIWRIGAKHPKSKQLLMRYATTADKKAKGAGARSLYYLIHGRPQQQEQKAKKRGLVSSSRRRKINADQSRIKTEINRGPEVEILDQDVDENMDAYDEEMDVDEPPIKVLISEDMLGDETPAVGSLYADHSKNKNIRSRLSKPSASVMQARRKRFLPNSAKMDEDQLKNNINNSDVSDLRQKLKNRKKRFDPQKRPNLSIEITED